MQWEVVGVLVVLIGLISTIVVPLLKLNSSIVKLTVTLDSTNKDIGETQKDLDSHIKKNSESHGGLWEHNKVQDAKLEDHEKRIYAIERK